MMAGVPDARFDAVQLYKFVTGRWTRVPTTAPPLLVNDRIMKPPVTGASWRYRAGRVAAARARGE